VNATSVLIILHTLTGAEIAINPKLITSMRASIPDQANKVLAQGVNCLINMTDGKFVTVKESCNEVRALMK
jgi:uncharacterized protein YlzI (FlbEa/FlbD family)